MLGKSFRNRYLPECSASNFGRQIRKKPPVMAASFVSLPFASYQQSRGVAEAVPVAPRPPCALRVKVPPFVSLLACAPGGTACTHKLLPVVPVATPTSYKN